jgi:hypothetical protein
MTVISEEEWAEINPQRWVPSEEELRERDRLQKFSIIFGIANDLDPNLVFKHAQFLINRKRCLGFKQPLRYRLYPWTDLDLLRAIDESSLDHTPQQFHTLLVVQMRKRKFV